MKCSCSRPSYAMYRFYAEVAGAARQRDRVPRRPAIGVSARGVARRHHARHPRHPDRQSEQPHRHRLSAWTASSASCKRAPDAAVLIDEAYYEFCGVTALPLIDACPQPVRQPHIFEGLRHGRHALGCLFSHDGEHRVPAQSAVALQREYAGGAGRACRRAGPRTSTNYVTEVLAAREAALRRARESSASRTYPSAGQFRPDAVRRTAPSKSATSCAGTAILVRDRSYEIPGCVRVTVGTREQTRRFLTALEEIWSNELTFCFRHGRRAGGRHANPIARPSPQTVRALHRRGLSSAS